MRLVLIYIVIGFIFFTSNWLESLPRQLTSKPLVSVKNITPSIAKHETALKALPEPKPAAKPKLLKVITPNRATKIALMKISFAQLPGWNEADFKKSLLAFQTSCKTFLKQAPTQSVGTQHINLQAKDWYPACTAASLLSTFSETNAKNFFEKWFHPIQFNYKKPINGLFTGYYMPQMKGSLTKTKQYNTPIYGLPNNKQHLKHSRREIAQGALQHAAPVLAWIHNPLDRASLETEGSGVIELTNGKRLYVSYAGQNGATYSSIENLMIKQGIMTKHRASKQAIQHYFQQHPNQVNQLLNKNRSFVFFQNLKQPGAIGAKGITLTPGYSLAIDKKWIPLGAPLWLVTQKPLEQQQENHQSKQLFQRLMIAQDTGGAIHGLMRGDIFWGLSKTANFLGENMKDTGRYWLLLPKHILNKLRSAHL